jgi:hypothetical protein
LSRHSRVYNYRIAVELLIWVHQYPPKMLFPDSNLSGEKIALEEFLAGWLINNLRIV